jgi:hypothetical protein
MTTEDANSISAKANDGRMERIMSFYALRSAFDVPLDALTAPLSAFLWQNFLFALLIISFYSERRTERVATVQKRILRKFLMENLNMQKKIG